MREGGRRKAKHLTMTTKFEFAEKETMPGIEIFLTILCDEREYTRKSGPRRERLALRTAVSGKEVTKEISTHYAEHWPQVEEFIACGRKRSWQNLCMQDVTPF